MKSPAFDSRTEHPKVVSEVKSPGLDPRTEKLKEAKEAKSAGMDPRTERSKETRIREWENKNRAKRNAQKHG